MIDILKITKIINGYKYGILSYNCQIGIKKTVFIREISDERSRRVHRRKGVRKRRKFLCQSIMLI